MKLKQAVIRAIGFQVAHGGFPVGLKKKMTYSDFAPLYNNLHGRLEDGLQTTLHGYIEELLKSDTDGNPRTYYGLSRDEVRAAFEGKPIDSHDPEVQEHLKQAIDLWRADHIDPIAFGHNEEERKASADALTEKYVKALENGEDCSWCHWDAYVRDKIREYDTEVIELAPGETKLVQGVPMTNTTKIPITERGPRQYVDVSDDDLTAMIHEEIGTEPLVLPR